MTSSTTPFDVTTGVSEADVLRYRGNPMDERDSRGDTPQEIAASLLRHGAVFVEWEPGDATSYHLHIHLCGDARPFGEFWIVNRTESGELLGSCIVNALEHNQRDVEKRCAPLGIGNQWTVAAVAWYLRRMFVAFNKIKGGDTG